MRTPLILSVFWTLLASCTPGRDDVSGVVIVNARVIDGSGGPSQTVNVRIVGDRIEAVGRFEPPVADDIVDAGGLVLAPGFVDTHSHHEPGIFEMPDAPAAVSQGITTIVAGKDGSQPFPLADFFARLDESPAAVNVASYAGHGTLRSLDMGEDYRRQATPEEVSAMADLLQIEMNASALGLATGLEYDPGSFSTTGELIALASVAASSGGRYMSHIRSEDRYFWQAIDETVAIGRAAGLPARVSHMKLAMTRWWGQSDRLVDTLEAARASGVDITADVYPYRAWNAGFSWLVTLFPERDLDRREGADYILNDMLSPEGILLATYLPEPAYDGMTIAEIAGIRETDPATTLVELLKSDLAGDRDGPGSQMLGIAMNEADIEAIMAWPHTVVSSDGELEGVHPRGFGAFTRYLGHYIRERGILSIEEGIRRITSLPAQQVGITERGAIDKGYYADLVLLDPDRVNDRATRENPHLPSTCIVRVWVNGEVVYANGETTGRLPGRPIRGNDT